MVDLQEEAQLGEEDDAIPNMGKVVGGKNLSGHIVWCGGLNFVEGWYLKVHDFMPYLSPVVTEPAARK